MHKDSFDFVYNAEGDYYDLVVDKKIYCKDADYFELDRESHCSYYEFLLEAVCHILTLVMKDMRTEQRYSNAMVWHINTINMLYGQIFQSTFTSFEDFLYGDATEDTFAIGYNCLVEKDTE